MNTTIVSPSISYSEIKEFPASKGHKHLNVTGPVRVRQSKTAEDIKTRLFSDMMHKRTAGPCSCNGFYFRFVLKSSLN